MSLTACKVNGRAQIHANSRVRVQTQSKARPQVTETFCILYTDYPGPQCGESHEKPEIN